MSHQAKHAGDDRRNVIPRGSESSSELQEQANARDKKQQGNWPTGYDDFERGQTFTVKGQDRASWTVRIPPVVKIEDKGR
jgi:hypothetical protein